MAKRFVAGVGWIDTDDVAAGKRAAPVGWDEVSQDERNQAFADERTARANAYGSDNWVQQYFPEYSEVDTSVKHTVGRGGLSVTRTVPKGNDVVRLTSPWTSLGFRELWNSTPESERQALADSINFYRNGGNDAQGFQAIDPKTFNGLKYQGENQFGQNIFSNERGTLVGSHIPQMYSEGSPQFRGQEYGINSKWTGVDGNTFETKYYHTVLRDFSPDSKYSGIGKYVPGWNMVAKNLGLESYARAGNYSRGFPNFEFAGAEVGTNLYGSYGFMWDKDVKTRRQTRDMQRYGSLSVADQRSGYRGTAPSGGGGGSGGGGSGGGSGGNFPGGSPTGPGQTPSQPPQAPGTGAPPRNPWEEDNSGAPGRGPMDYGPAPFSPYGPAGYDPYGGNSYSGYGDSGSEYRRPIFGGDSQWQGMYQDWLGGGIDVGKYAPELGGDQSAAQQMSQEPTTVPVADSGGSYYDYYRRYIGGGSRGNVPKRIY